MELPYVEGADDASKHITHACAGLMGYWHAAIATKASGPRLSESQTRCLAARLYAECTRSLLAREQQLAASDRPGDPQAVPRSEAAAAAAARFLRVSCDGVVADPTTEELFKKVAKLWQRNMKDRAIDDD